MKKTVSILLCVLMLISVFSSALPVFAAEFPENGWFTDGNGKTYYFQDGKRVNGWKEIDGKKYYFNPEMFVSGYRYVPEESTYYLFEKDGTLHLKEGWANLDDYGYEAEGCFWVYCKSDGSLEKGWKKLNGKWYYLRPLMVFSESSAIDGKVYLFEKSGALTKRTGWISVYNPVFEEKNWYYVEKNNGVCSLGWKKINGSWYYFDTYDGNMLSNGVISDGNGNWFLEKNGKFNPKKNGWVKSEFRWFYVENGKAVTGWKKIKDNWYYFDIESGVMASSGGFESDGKVYLFEKNGALTQKTGWVSFTYDVVSGDGRTGTYTEWYYVTKGGVAATGWKKIKDDWYFFAGWNGRMYTGTVYSDGKLYYLEKSGKLTKKTGWHAEKYMTRDGKEAANWYYTDKGGICRTGAWRIKDKLYLFNDYGRMISDSVEKGEDGVLRYYSESGACLENCEGWLYLFDGFLAYYFKNGEALTSWQEIDSNTYYFDPDNGVMYRNGEYQIDSVLYYFDENGLSTVIG